MPSALTACGIFGKILLPPEPQYPHLYNGKERDRTTDEIQEIVDIRQAWHSVGLQ